MKSTVTICKATLIALCAHIAFGADTTGQTASHSTPLKRLGYPIEGVLLAQGWDSFENRPANAICVDYQRAVIPGHELDIKFDSISTRYQLNRAMSLSVSGSYSGFGSVSGSASFSKSLAIDNSNTNILATVQVLKGDEFVAPSQDSKGSEASASSLSVGLTARALTVLKKQGSAAFRALCGDSFVYHIRSGGRLNAYLTFEDLSAEQKRSMSTALSASGWGASVSATYKMDEAIKNSSSNTNIRIFQVGGPLQPTPVNVSDFQSSVRGFLASSDPDLFPTKPYEIGLMRYDSLYNWTADNRLGDPADLQESIVLYWLLDDLRAQYVSALENHDRYFMIQPEKIDTAATVVTASTDGLCFFKYDAKDTKKWVSQPNSSRSGCDFERDVVESPWTLENILERENGLKAQAKALKLAIDGCVTVQKGQKDYSKCTLNASLEKVKMQVTSHLKSMRKS